MAFLKAVVFDLGGVLIDRNPRYLYRKLFRDEGQMEWFLANVCTPAWNARQDAGRSVAQAVEEATGRHPEYHAMVEAYYARSDEMMAGPIAGTVDVLDDLAARQIPLYALTNWPGETFDVARRRFNFFERFRGVVVSGVEGVKKPDPRIYRVLAQRYTIDPRQAVFVDDKPSNVRAATGSGFTGIHFTGPAALRGKLASLGLLSAR